MCYLWSYLLSSENLCNKFFGEGGKNKCVLCVVIELEREKVKEKKAKTIIKWKEPNVDVFFDVICVCLPKFFFSILASLVFFITHKIPFSRFALFLLILLGEWMFSVRRKYITNFSKQHQPNQPKSKRRQWAREKKIIQNEFTANILLCVCVCVFLSLLSSFLYVSWSHFFPFALAYSSFLAYFSSFSISLCSDDFAAPAALLNCRYDNSQRKIGFILCWLSAKIHNLYFQHPFRFSWSLPPWVCVYTAVCWAKVHCDAKCFTLHLNRRISARVLGRAKSYLYYDMEYAYTSTQKHPHRALLLIYSAGSETEIILPLPHSLPFSRFRKLIFRAVFAFFLIIKLTLILLGFFWFELSLLKHSIKIHHLSFVGASTVGNTNTHIHTTTTNWILNMNEWLEWQWFWSTLL